MTLFRKNDSRSAAVVLIAGEGGHLEQARRIRARFAPDVASAVRTVLITDTSSSSFAAFDEVVQLCNPSPKERAPTRLDVSGYLADSWRELRQLRRRYRVVTVVVTGPGFAFLPAVFFRLLGAYLIVFESWSRFENRSKCSQVLYRFAHQFLIQHKELKKLYPKAIWVGLL